MTITETFLLALALVMGLPWLVWRVLRTDNWAPLVVVQIVAGVLLGPGVLGVALPQVHDFLFPPGVIAALNGIAWWAVMIFVWLAGIELDLHQAWVARRETWTTAGLALVTPLALGALAAALILTQPGWIGAKGQHWQALLGMGMACAVTALPILVLLMDRLTILRQPLGQRVLRYASLDDIAIWGVLALILLDWARVERQAGFLLLFPFVAWGLRAVMRRIGGRDRLYLGMLSLALLGFAADWAGLHFMVGAFLAGAILDKEWFDEAQMDMLRDHMLLTVMPVFFLSTGLRTQWDMGGFEVIGGALLLLAAAVVGKLAGVALAGRILGWPKGEAGVIGWLLQTKALIMIIFANILLDRQIITGTSFTALLLMAIGSTMLTMPMVRRGLARLKQG
ncbi:cation:proton antiporter [Sphingobium sp. SA2]|uniref:cation:proton antiporter n=1 Tax=Sphingobium sp. SA2 TaxID=1524832 RepID=UPI0028C0897D|nr:cation:proton antiporter [Sphingobium sp. SA2]MDT7534429.1 cation:proton antiporter [Sphingobium sp. SA2]